ncbi:uncharacterized protein LOC143008445 [Genypterus blacodes]|uniref:uncharacterized protein LOC143008445 n=1 Tax=Genypterus blacodes TaxID=154954 RepID=UPI003F7708A3
MAASMAGVDTLMEELVDQDQDQDLGLEETSHSLLRGPSLRDDYHSDALLVTDFMIDDRSSAASGLDVVDRLTYLEQRMQMQEDEIQLLKLALSDVLKRLTLSEEHQTSAGRRTPGVKARPGTLALPSRPHTLPSAAAPLKKSNTLPSASTTRNYSSPPTLPNSAVRSPTGSVKDGACKAPKPRPTAAAAPSCKKQQDSSSKDKESSVSLGTRRVTHCKVTMQIFLSPLRRKTGSSETSKSAPAVPASDEPKATPAKPQVKGAARTQTRKTPPSFNLNLQKNSQKQKQKQNTTQDTFSYKSPVKSPSQYFQICY